jgi:hypothetical protein
MGIDFMENVLLILPVPAEYSELDKAIMRECAFNAGLINNRFSEKLQFTTERMFIIIIYWFSLLRRNILMLILKNEC